MSETIEFKAERVEVNPNKRSSYTTDMNVEVEVYDFGEVLSAIPLTDIVGNIDTEKALDIIGVEKVKDYFDLVEKPEET